MTEGIRFFKEARRSFQTTGAILPSGRLLGRALSSALKPPRAEYRILEVGPGTGSVTAEILKRLQSGDRFDIVELNDRFVRMLEERFQNEPIFQSHKDQVRIMNMPLENVEGVGCYDVIVSGLPLNNFPVAQVKTIFEAYHRLLKPGGSLSYFEYAFVRSLKLPFVGKSERARLSGVGDEVSEQIRKFQVDKQFVLLNVPPAFARHLRFASANSA